MVLSAPRSGSAWAANWLSLPGHVCLHEPLWDHYLDDLDALPHVWGAACTALGRFPEWVNAHPSPKVILHRPLEAINRSLQAVGLPWADPQLIENLWKCHGMHTAWSDLFTLPGAKAIHEHLEVGAFDQERWEMLRYLKVTSLWQERARAQNVDVARRLGFQPWGPNAAPSRSE
jgi:hypothetical protein